MRRIVLDIKCTKYTEWCESDSGADLFPTQTVDWCSISVAVFSLTCFICRYLKCVYTKTKFTLTWGGFSDHLLKQYFIKLKQVFFLVFFAFKPHDTIWRVNGNATSQEISSVQETTREEFQEERKTSSNHISLMEKYGNMETACNCVVKMYKI